VQRISAEDIVMKKILLLIAACASLFGAQAFAEDRSDYVFQYNAGASELFMKEMVFASEEPLDLDECQTTFKINGPLGCAVNCSDQPVCLLVFSGPSGLGTSDILTKVEEVPSESDDDSTLMTKIKPQFFKR
jgi:hypothetical protein